MSDLNKCGEQFIGMSDHFAEVCILAKGHSGTHSSIESIPNGEVINQCPFRYQGKYWKCVLSEGHEGSHEPFGLYSANVENSPASRLHKYEISAFVSSSSFAVDCWTADSDEEMARIIANCARRKAGIAEVRVLLNGSAGAEG